MKRLEGKPFALLGINSDSDREKLKAIVKEKEITWRSWWDGGSRRGPIATTWNIKGWPTIYILDHNGVIRGKNLHNKELDALIDELLAEIK